MRGQEPAERLYVRLPTYGGGVTVNQRSKEDIAEIEATQAALRDSIQATKQLAEKAETLLQQHKEALEKESSKRSE